MLREEAEIGPHSPSQSLYRVGTSTLSSKQPPLNRLQLAVNKPQNLAAEALLIAKVVVDHSLIHTSFPHDVIDSDPVIAPF